MAKIGHDDILPLKLVDLQGPDTIESVADNCDVKISEVDGSNLVSDLIDRLNAQARVSAEQMHQARTIYAIYGLLDGLNISYGLLKLIFDLILAKKGGSPYSMHDWTLTPTGIAAAAAESITLITFSMLANYYKDDDPKLFKRLLATYWPYMRDVFKSFKNSYKGLRSTLSAIKIISGNNLNFLIFPVGLALGALSMCNRLIMRRLINKRKDMMEANANLLKEIQAKQSITKEEASAFRARAIAGQQSAAERITGLVATAMGSAIDSMYLYMGVLGMCALSGPLMPIMLGCCSIFAVLCIATRIYEEYDFQRRLIVRKARIEMALTSKEYAADMQLLIEELNELSNEIALDPSNEILQQKKSLIEEQANDTIREYAVKRKKLQDESMLSDMSAILAGMKNGLAVYSALASSIFAIYTILALCSIPFPPALLVSLVVLGLVGVVGFTLYSYHQNREHCEKIAQKAEEPSARLIDFIHIPKTANAEANKVTINETIPALFDQYMVLDPGPRNYIMEWSENFRSLGSGPSKGPKSIEFIMNPLGDVDEQGQYHDSKLMLAFSVVSSLIHAIVLSLRAHARGFGKPDDFYTEHLAFQNQKASMTTQEPSVADEDNDEFMEKPKPVLSFVEKPQPVLSTQESVQITERGTDSTTSMRRSVSVVNEFSFFQSKKPSSLFRSKSLHSLPDMQINAEDTDILSDNDETIHRKRSVSAITHTAPGLI